MGNIFNFKPRWLPIPNHFSFFPCLFHVFLLLTFLFPFLFFLCLFPLFLCKDILFTLLLTSGEIRSACLLSPTAIFFFYIDLSPLYLSSHTYLLLTYICLFPLYLFRHTYLFLPLSLSLYYILPYWIFTLKHFFVFCLFLVEFFIKPIYWQWPPTCTVPWS